MLHDAIDTWQLTPIGHRYGDDCSCGGLGGYLRASIGLFGWLLVRAGAQVTMVLLLTRTLGAEGYGQFVAVLAVAGFFAPLAGLGLSGVVLREGARHPERLPELLGDSLATWWRSTVVFAPAAVAATVWLSPPGVSLLAMAQRRFHDLPPPAEQIMSSLNEMNKCGGFQFRLLKIFLRNLVTNFAQPAPGGSAIDNAEALRYCRPKFS